MTSKQLVRALFQRKELSRPPFIPIVTSFAAKLGQVSVHDLLTNPTRLANTLQASQRLFGYDAIVGVYDPSIEAEACGCAIEWPSEDSLPVVVGHPLAEGKSIPELELDAIDKRGRLPVALEAVKRISMVAGRDVAMVGTVTGPVSLAVHLRGETFLDELRNGDKAADDVLEAAGKVLSMLSRLYCDLKMDAILVHDEELERIDPALFPKLAPFYLSAANIVRFYDAAFLVFPGNVHGFNPGTICQLESDAVMLDNGAVPDALSLLARQGRSFGAALPPSVLNGTKELAARAIVDQVSHGSKRGFFLSTSGEIPYATPVENMHEIMRAIK